jgi:hypothetical protein
MQLTGTSFCLVLNRAWVGRAVNWYGFVFETGYSRGGVCSLQVRVCVWNLIELRWGVQLTGTGSCLELNRAGVGCELIT